MSKNKNQTRLKRLHSQQAISMQDNLRIKRQLRECRNQIRVLEKQLSLNHRDDEIRYVEIIELQRIIKKHDEALNNASSMKITEISQQFNDEEQDSSSNIWLKVLNDEEARDNAIQEYKGSQLPQSPYKKRST